MNMTTHTMFPYISKHNQTFYWHFRVANLSSDPVESLLMKKKSNIHVFQEKYNIQFSFCKSWIELKLNCKTVKQFFSRGIHGWGEWRFCKINFKNGFSLSMHRIFFIYGVKKICLRTTGLFRFYNLDFHANFILIRVT